MLVSRQVKYVVLKPFRFSGRAYEPGAEFNARRADPTMGRLRKWVEEGYLGFPGEKSAPAKEPVKEPLQPVKEPESEKKKGFLGNLFGRGKKS